MTYQLRAPTSQHIASEIPGSRTVEGGTITATTSGTTSMVRAQHTATHTFMSRYGPITAQYLYTRITCISPHMLIFQTALETYRHACRDACDAEILHCYWHLLQHLPLCLMRHQIQMLVI